MSRLSKRASSILYAVVSEFIETGEPVGSRTLTKRYGLDLSAATVRTVLADLEDAGFLTQPHTSAGRVPTLQAFRVFVDALMRTRELRREDLSRIADWFEGLPPGTDLVRASGQLLSSLTGAAALVSRPRIETRTLNTIRFVKTRPGELLCVVVFLDGTVENRYVALDRPLSETELARLHNMLEGLTHGRTLVEVRAQLEHGIRESRDELDTLRRLGVFLVDASIQEGGQVQDLVVEGQARLLARPEFQNTADARDVLLMLEDRERLVGLVNEMLSATRIQVFFDTSDQGEQPVSLVVAPYHQESGRPGGGVGIVGPTRMDYPTVLPIVEAMADALSAAMARSDASGQRPVGRLVSERDEPDDFG